MNTAVEHFVKTIALVNFPSLFPGSWPIKQWRTLLNCWACWGWLRLSCGQTTSCEEACVNVAWHAYQSACNELKRPRLAAAARASWSEDVARPSSRWMVCKAWKCICVAFWYCHSPKSCPRQWALPAAGQAGIFQGNLHGTYCGRIAFWLIGCRALRRIFAGHQQSGVFGANSAATLEVAGGLSRQTSRAQDNFK